MGGIELKQFLLTFLGSFSGIITAFIVLNFFIKLIDENFERIVKYKNEKWNN